MTHTKRDCKGEKVKLQSPVHIESWIIGTYHLLGPVSFMSDQCPENRLLEPPD